MSVSKPKSSPALVTAMAETMLSRLRSDGECTETHLQEAGFTPRQITQHQAEARAQAAAAERRTKAPISRVLP